MNDLCRERFDRWLTGELDQDAWNEHLGGCRECAREAEGFRALFAVLAADAEVEPAPALDAAVRLGMPGEAARDGAIVFDGTTDTASASRVLRPGFAIGLAAAAWCALAAAIGLAAAAAGWASEGIGIALATLGLYGTTTVVAAVPLFWLRRGTAGNTVNA
ncbi:MAG: hypothetical protein OER88_14995 [Planctomycetota bacterium]|nr:hypothetical protein [Planctomycetota bacterium]